MAYAGDLKAPPASADSRHPVNIASAVDARSPEIPHLGQSWGTDGGVDPVEIALASSLVAASAAGQWAVVSQLAKELEARRLTGSNVATLDTARRRGR
jgi:hypothetical protein